MLDNSDELKARGTDNSLAKSFMICGALLSGPAALDGFSLSNFVQTISVSIVGG